MIGSNIDNNAQDQQDQMDITDQLKSKFIQIQSTEYESVKAENSFLKSIIFNHIKEHEFSGLELKKDNKISVNNSKFDLIFYIKIILAIFVIMLAFAFHIVYLSVASCLFYTNGNSSCWIKSWLGIRVYASFFIDLTLYLLIGFQLVLIILILKSKINELNSKN